VYQVRSLLSDLRWDRVIILQPLVDAMIVSHFPHGPTVFFTLHNVTLRHDIASYKESTVSEQYPHLIFENFSSQLGGRIRDVLKYLFPVPKEDSKRVMTFSNEDDFISFR
jgi:U3 small nucleolar ribonucleoprotein protein IMP4